MAAGIKVVTGQASAFTCSAPKTYVIKINTFFKLKYKRIKQLFWLRSSLKTGERKQKAVVSLADCLKSHQTTIFTIVHKLVLPLSRLTNYTHNSPYAAFVNIFPFSALLY